MTTVGLVGCGNWGRNILRDLVALGVTVHVADPAEARRAFAIQSGASTAVAHHRELPDCEGLLVAVPIPATGGLVLDLLDRAVPLFVEKPIATSVEIGRDIVRTARRPVFVMDKWRYHPAVQAVNDLVRAGRLGPVRSIRLERWGWWDTARDVSSLWWLAPHDLSIALHWLGMLPPVVSARRISSRGIDDYLVVLQEGAGAPVTLDIRTSSPTHRRAFTVAGKHATVQLVDADAEHLVLREHGAHTLPTERFVPLARVLPLESELRCFVGYLNGGPAPVSSASDGLAVLERLVEIERLAG